MLTGNVNEEEDKEAYDTMNYEPDVNTRLKM